MLRSEVPGIWSALDQGGSSGSYAIAFAKGFPDVRCEILDLPEIVLLMFEMSAALYDALTFSLREDTSALKEPASRGEG